MTNNIVLDTNVLVALLGGQDVHNAQASRLAERLDRTGKRCVLLDCIVNEVFTVFARRCIERQRKFSESVTILKNKLSIFPLIRSYSLIRRYHNRIIDLMTATEGKLNYHDALIGLTMQEKNLVQIATFDRNFEEIDWVQVVAA